MSPSDEGTTQAVLVSQSELSTEQGVENLALFYPDGSPVDFTSDTVQGPQGDPGIGVVDQVTTATAIGTAAKTTTSVEPVAGSVVAVKFTNGNSANSPTVAFNGGSARAIQLGGVASTGAKLTVAAGGVVPFFFDGTVLHQFGTVA